jgi:hypothetical protein
MARDVFDAEGYLKSKGLELAGMSESGKPLYRTPKGEEVELDVSSYLKSKGIPVDKLDLQLNSMNSPVNVSPVSTLDRAKLAFGNTRGGMKYLKSKFEDVGYNEDSGLVVKNKGVWHRVDPDNDPWELSAELAKDIMEGSIKVGPSVAGQAAGAAAGTAMAGPIAGVVGSGVGAGLARKLTTSLGRLVGTYDATPEEEVQDLGFETLLGMGGQLVSLGAKPTLSALANLSKGVFGKAAEGTKAMASQVLGKTTSAGPVATRTLIDHSDEVAREIGATARTHASAEAMKETFKAEQVGIAKQMLESADDALPKKYGELLDNLITSEKGSKVRADIGGIIGQSKSVLEEMGAGKIVAGKFRRLTQSEAAERLGQGLPVEALDDTAFAQINDLVKALDTFGGTGKLSGQSAAKALTQVNKALNNVERDLFKRPEIAAVVERAAGKIGARFKEATGKAFDEAGLAGEYTQLQSLYGQFGNAVRAARVLLKQSNGPEVFVNKLLSQPGNNSAAKTMRNEVVELLGERGEQLAHKLRIKESAKQFSSWAPKMGLVQVGSGAVAAMKGGAVAATNPALAVATAASFSPRAVAHGVRAANKSVAYVSSLKNFVTGLPPEKLKELLADPKLTGEMFRTVISAYGQEDASLETLLTEAGVK